MLAPLGTHTGSQTVITFAKRTRGQLEAPCYVEHHLSRLLLCFRVENSLELCRHCHPDTVRNLWVPCPEEHCSPDELFFFQGLREQSNSRFVQFSLESYPQS